ncbi:GNAT family N-acetyltransferase [Agrobacterium vitis]|uniref:acyl-homoserine-lactone synthase n=1 Tax=Agrobacterium vitis TaxID=373 RepID=UPI0009BD400F|nr:acyl-homoserine-lactone synthase [Agrobacterium vitis]MCE6078369.1 GNAT family N-acetyltransferase [Agrobacterium vitis]MUO73366.1 GNAT family N-acetyltransferase [Agrobacterium vitis]MUO87565.1 GNAT family N-acetyltransferase [Agrobacterium vitis]
MLILTASPDRYVDRSNLLKQMHCLRAAVFRERLEWEVTITEAGERDEYDDFDPTYIVAITDDERVVGCARLLPAIGPTMLERTFPHLLATGSLNASDRMIESSRFCVDTSLPAGRGGGQLHFATLTMFAGIIEWSMENGYDGRCCTDQISTVSVYVAAIENSLIDHPCHTNITPLAVITSAR